MSESEVLGTRRQSNRPKRIYADNKYYHTPLVRMMYLAGSRGIAATVSIKDSANKLKRTDRPSLFDYEIYTKKVRSSVKRFLFGWLKNSFHRI
ncbi:MAG: hypothetical protein M3275_15830 [Thermoproteota archaeon]|nr:hypothetical protein [Thermoproteota archaeon]